MGWFESESEKAQREYEEGQAAGSKAGLMDDFMQSMCKSLTSEAYDKGWENGKANPSKD